jgi:hypothetical protein
MTDLISLPDPRLSGDTPLEEVTRASLDQLCIVEALGASLQRGAARGSPRGTTLPLIRPYGPPSRRTKGGGQIDRIRPLGGTKGDLPEA